MLKRGRASLLLLCFLLLVFSIFCWGTGCSPGTPKKELQAPAEKEAVKVVATIFPLADIARQIGGEGTKVTALLTPGASPHTYEPTVEQAKAVAEADLLIFIGAGLDDWAAKLALSAEHLLLLEITAHLKGELLKYDPALQQQLSENGNPSTESHNEFDGRHEHQEDEEDGYEEHHEHEDSEEDQGLSKEHPHHYHHSEIDPHIWLDPVLVKDSIAPLISAKLKEISPQKADFFDENLRSFQQKLSALDEEIRELTASFTQRRFISLHSAWNYFARRYNLEEAASVMEFPGKEPSAGWIAELVELAERENIRVVFAEPQLGSKAAQIIAGEIGGKVLLLDPLGGEGLPGRESYLELMRYNVKILQEALK